MTGALISAVVIAAMSPIVPYEILDGSDEEIVRNLREVKAASGLNRFLLSAPGFDACMFEKPETGIYGRMGARIGRIGDALKADGIEVGWWCSPTIRYRSDFQPIVDAEGHESADNKKCPLDPAFAADWCAKIREAVLASHPKIVFIEDDYALSNGRGLTGLRGCFCPRHIELTSKLYGRPVTVKAIADAFRRRTAANLALRRAFGSALRETMVGLAKKVRETVDAIDPTIRICLCDTGYNADKDGDAIEAEIRAFAGGTRPAVRPHGSIYGAETTPANIPRALCHAMFNYERLPRDIETFHEADSYPHNRFYSSASAHLSLMAGAVAMGAQDFLFYCLQYLDDPFEEKGYVEEYLKLKPRLEALRDFIHGRDAHLHGVRVYWTPDDLALTRDQGLESGHGGQLGAGCYLLAKMSMPYTTRRDAPGPVLLMEGVVEVMDDEEIRRVLSGGVLVDAPAAALLTERGFGRYLGTGVELFAERQPITREYLLPAAGCTCRGRHCNAYYAFPAGTEGTVRKFARLSPRPGTEVWCEFRDYRDRVVTPSLTFATNALGGRVAVMGVSLIGNRSSGLFNYRKQELLGNLFRRMDPSALPIAARNAPGIWCLASIAADGRDMAVFVDNLSGDVRGDLVFDIAPEWRGAEVSRLAPDGGRVPAGRAGAAWSPGVSFGQMQPEMFFFRRR